MRNFKRRLIALLVAVVITISLCVVPAMAADGIDTGDFELMATDIVLSDAGDELEVCCGEAHEDDEQIIGMDVETVPADEEETEEGSFADIEFTEGAADEESIDPQKDAEDTPEAEETAEEDSEENEEDAEEEENEEALRLAELEAEFAGFEAFDYDFVQVENPLIDSNGFVFHNSFRVHADSSVDNIAGYSLSDLNEFQIEALRVLAQTTKTYNDAVVDARALMKNRTEEFEVVFVTDSEITDDPYDICMDFYANVFAHTGNPKEGDYLKWQVGNYSFHPVAVKMNNKYYYTFECGVTYYDTAEQEAEVDAAVSSALASIGLSDGSFHTDYSKIFRIYNYVTQKVKYGNSSNTNGYSAYGSMVLNKSVCQGYTLAIYRLALEAGLDARIVVSQPADHAWNIVRIGNAYYNLDATWDRNSDSDPWWIHFLYGDAGHSVGETFIPGDESFRDSHLAVLGDPNSYYRPSWVDSYNIPNDCYPCFASYDKFAQLYPYGNYIKQVHVSENINTTCVANASGYCVTCGQYVGHTHVFDQQIEESAFLATPGNCQTLPTYYYSCTCGTKGTETFSGTEYGPHIDEDYNDVCDVCENSIEHVCMPQKLTKVPYKASTCIAEGNIEYYRCSCGKLYSDVNATTEITQASTVIPFGSHVDNNEDDECDVCHTKIDHICTPGKLTKVPAKASTCKEQGNIEHYECTCGKLYADAQAKNPITLESTLLPLADHVDNNEDDLCDVCHTKIDHICTPGKLTKVPAKASTCSEQGNIEYYVCTCGKLYTDSSLSQSIELKDTKLPKTAHIDKNDDGICDECQTHTGHMHSQYTLTRHEQKDATCTADGTKAYYSCSCGKLYTAADMKTETTLAKLKIPALGHDFSSFVVKVEPTTTSEGLKVYSCSRCDATKEEVMPKKTEPSRKIKVETGKNMIAYADGIAVSMDSSGYIELPNYDIKVVTTFTYNTTDTATNYPEQNSMKVYFISKDKEGNLIATRDKSFDGIMQYMGASVRCDGNKGIRIITGIPVKELDKLKNGGLNGWKLTEYGTIVGNDAYLTSSVVFGSPKTASAQFNDKPFAHNGATDSYTVGLTFNDMEQCKVVFSMRPYMKISNGSTTVILYGGIVHRSIGYVAWQNRNAFNPKTQPTNYNFIQEIIKYCGFDK